ncbi:Alkaline phosphatase precursor [Luteitalea pratensis]|uniref:Alkaline phosphatase n=1 Tax=Luteitalea pratensis TaxID=1855912 RepID=A0A143PJN6_LUTPR|nr:metallophosphoesterase [Luteitalea pratensis]AMY08278.1 Alkaline phosphatase precursor [Luteitalea pratensis]
MRQQRLTTLAAAIVLVLTATLNGGCDKPSSTQTAVSPTAPSFPGASISEAVLVGAGDISMCGQPGAEATAKLLDDIPGTVFASGDNAYMKGSVADFQCYDRTWGRHKSRTYASPGNHEYESGGASPYFDYFGERAGPSGLGYYAFDLGGWHVVSLNSNVPMGEGSAQLAWLRAELQRSRATCVAAIMHHPLVSSGPNGDNPQVREVWRALVDAGADVVISSHDHLYERHARMDQDGRPSPRGLRQFTVGTGGATLYRSGGGMRPTTEAKAMVWGVIKFTLLPSSYRWEFVSVDGILDGGIDMCQ